MTGWELTEDSLVPSLLPWKESLFTVSNGYLGTRGSFEEGIVGETRATFINGLFVTPPGELPLLGALPDWTRVVITVDGEPLDLGVRPPAGYRRVLDLRHGLLERTILWKGAESGVVRFRFRRLASMEQPHLVALEVEAEALTDSVDLTMTTGIDTTVGSPSDAAWRTEEVELLGLGQLRVGALSVDGSHRLDVATSIRASGGREGIDQTEAPGHPWVRVRRSLQPGDVFTLTKFVNYHADRDPDPRPSLPAEQSSFDAVAAASAAAWEERWSTSEIEVDGDPESQLALRFAAWSLAGAVSSTDPGSAAGAKLLSGFGYRHHVFWDTDIFIIPYLTLTRPAAARNHIAYRYRGLPGARRKAAHYGREGAFFAWESADTGDEVTPEWGSDDGERVRIWTGEIEEHIVADIAWAIDHYLDWTGDEECLLDQGAEIILEGARYWAGRLEDENDGAHLRGVIGPDEYHTKVDDNLFTNAMAAWQLRKAAGLVGTLSAHHPGRARQLLDRLGIDPQVAESWRGLAGRVALRSDSSGVWEQHRGFFELEPIDLGRFRPRNSPMYDIIGEKGVERSQVVKQADVVMAMALLGETLGDVAVQRANWDYYWPRTDHGSSLSLAIHSLLASRLGMRAEAFDAFRRAAAIDLADSMGNGRAGIHAATQGGLLQAALFGFAGVHVEDDEVRVVSRLPDHWDGLGFSLVHRGSRIEREVRNER
jgi:trehalose/maltose hydrolase-like predicted phosphorylase